MANLITDPSGAGQQFADGIIDRIGHRLFVGGLDIIDSVAFIAAFIGMFLYMLGIKKGGKITWVSLVLWFTARAVLVSL